MLALRGPFNNCPKLCRVIFGEAGLCAVICGRDKFSDVLVIQSLALGIDRYKEVLVELEEGSGRRWSPDPGCIRSEGCEGSVVRGHGAPKVLSERNFLPRGNHGEWCEISGRCKGRTENRILPGSEI